MGLIPSDIPLLTVAEIRARLKEAEAPEEDLVRALGRDPRAGVRALARSVRARVRRRTADARRQERLLTLERRLRGRGARLIAGVDEAGRGPLAGPVVAAAVVLPEKVSLPGLDDSKKLTPEGRDRFFDEIQRQAIAVGVGEVDNEEIDRINILQASLKAMRGAISALNVRPDRVLVDGNQRPGSGLPEVAIVDGDASSLSIAAASVIAKVTRDRKMIEYDREFPGYGFARHKGYGTREHIDALNRLGPCPIHRRSFQIVGDLYANRSEDFLAFREGLEAARNRPELDALAQAIRSAGSALPSREVEALRDIYRERSAALSRTGSKGEEIAAAFLEERGYRIIARNVRSAGGEIDLIARKEGLLVFVEVKADRTGAFGPPELRVDQRKQRQLVKIATRYLQQHAVEGLDLRFDVIGVRLHKGESEIEHIENAFWAEEG